MVTILIIQRVQIIVITIIMKKCQMVTHRSGIRKRMEKR